MGLRDRLGDPRTRQALVIGAVVLVLSFFGALALELSWVPDSLRAPIALYVQLTLPPTALIVFVVTGFIAARNGWLAGALLGLLDGVLWSALFIIVAGPSSAPSVAVGIGIGDILAVLALAVVIGLVAGGVTGAIAVAVGRSFRGQPGARPVPTIICRACGVRTPAEAAFCTACGVQLIDTWPPRSSAGEP